MRRVLLGLVVALGISAFGADAHAQLFGGINDPALAYYALYLPRQQAQSMVMGPEAILNNASAYQQQFAATNRNGMFDPNGGFDSQNSGPEFSGNGTRRKRAMVTNTGRFGVHGGNLNGLGPQGFYNNNLTKYYKDLRAGRGRNANVYAGSASRRGFSGGSGVSGGVGGLPGPR